MLSNWWYPPEEGSKSSARSSTDDGRGDHDDDTEIMEPDQGNGESTECTQTIPGSLPMKQSPMLTYRGAVLSHIISQLRPGADLSRVVLPTFILEPRSMLERITKCAHSTPLLLGRGAFFAPGFGGILGRR